MKYSTVIVAAGLAATVSAQFDGPDCFLPCLRSSLTLGVPNCGLTSIDGCCKSTDFIAPTYECLVKECGGDLEAAVAEAVKTCAGAGVDIKPLLPGGDDEETTTTSAEETTTTPAPEETTPAEEETTTTSAEETSTTEAPEETTPPPASNTTSGTPPVETVDDDSAAGKFAVSGVLAVLAAAVAFLA